MEAKEIDKPITVNDVEDDSLVDLVKKIQADYYVRGAVEMLNGAIDSFREVAFKTPDGASMTVVEIIGVLKSFRDDIKVAGGEKEKNIVVP